MLTDWSHWISTLHRDELIAALLPLLLFDSPRYALSAFAIWLLDFVEHLGAWAKPGEPQRFDYCPSVCVLIAGLNESATLGATLRSVLNSYPRLDVIVVDDGSRDEMSVVASRFAREHHNVQVITRSHRGGKSSALNHALTMITAEIVVCVDSDSHLEPNAIWEIVQPFKDNRVGAVSGNVGVRNAFDSFASWMQAVEYVRCIFLGRMFSSRVATLGIVSGAFGAYRTALTQRLGGWDVGPGEDGDLALRLRKAGYDVKFAPYAECRTNVPTSWLALIKQRRRWERAVVTFECRKHVDIGNPTAANFRWSNFALLVDRLTFNIFLQFAFWAYLVWLAIHPEMHVAWLFLLDYLVFLSLDTLQHGVILYYSNHRRRDLALCLAIPVMPLYYLFLRGSCCGRYLRRRSAAKVTKTPSSPPVSRQEPGAGKQMARLNVGCTTKRLLSQAV